MRIDNDQTIIAVQGELLKRLKRERIDQGVSQDEMAAKTGLSRAAVHQIENGKGARLSSFLLYLKALQKLDALNSLFPEQGPKPSDMLQLGKERQRISRKKNKPETKWKWKDET
jgi:transcriptional regulator with XRE-family HTH domain